MTPVLGAQYESQPQGVRFTFVQATGWPGKPGAALPGPAVDGGRWWENSAGYKGVFYSWNFTRLQKAGAYDVSASYYSGGQAVPHYFRCPTLLLGPWQPYQASCRIYVWPGQVSELTAAADAGTTGQAGRPLTLTVHGWDAFGNAAWFLPSPSYDSQPLAASARAMSASFRAKLSAELVAAAVAGPGGCSTLAACEANVSFCLDPEAPGKMYANFTATKAGDYVITFGDAGMVGSGCSSGGGLGCQMPYSGQPVCCRAATP